MAVPLLPKPADRRYGTFSLDDLDGEAELEWMWSTIEEDPEMEEAATLLASVDELMRYGAPDFQVNLNLADIDPLVARVPDLTIPFGQSIFHSRKTQVPATIVNTQHSSRATLD